MNRNIFAFILLLGVFSYLLNQITEMPFIMSFIVIAPMAMGIGFITIPAVYLLSKPMIIDKNYESGNVMIVVAVVVSAIMYGLYLYVNLDMYLISENLGLQVLLLSLGIDIIAFFRDYYRRWIYVAFGAHVVVFGIIILLVSSPNIVDFFFIQVCLYYLLIHSIFTVSYAILRHIIRDRFPYVSTFKL